MTQVKHYKHAKFIDQASGDTGFPEIYSRSEICKNIYNLRIRVYEP